MKAVVLIRMILWASLFISLVPPACAQGTVSFSNLNRGAGIDAPVTFADGTRVSANDDYYAKLYAARPGTPLTSLEPIFPIRPFRSNAPGYFEPLNLTVAGINPGEQAVVVVRAFQGQTWEGSICRGESNLLLVTLSGGLATPTDLTGLQSFEVSCVPEPYVWSIFVAGLILIFKRQIWGHNHFKKFSCLLAAPFLL